MPWASAVTSGGVLTGDTTRACEPLDTTGLPPVSSVCTQACSGTLPLSNAPEATGWSPARRRVVDNALRDFRLGGAELEPDARARFAQVQQELAELSAKFSEHVLDATDAYTLQIDDEARLAGLPADVVANARAASEARGHAGWTLTLQMPCYLPVQTYASHRPLREALYRANALRASEFGDAAALADHMRLCE